MTPHRLVPPRVSSPLPVALVALGVLLAPGRSNAGPHPSDWLHEARFGVFTHFLPGDGPSFARLEEFDAEALARQLESLGAGYLVFTLGQNSGYFNSPNATYDRITGYRAGERCARRDLPLDLYRALHPRGIRLMLYLPCQTPNRDRRAQRAFGLREGPRDQPIDLAFARKWAEVIGEWAARYRERVAGWWFDGGYAHIHFSEEIARVYAAAVKRGNPRAIVTFNPGVRLVRHTRSEDYTAGELNEPFEVLPRSRWVEGSQWHALTFLGSHWGARDTRYPAERWAEWVQKAVAAGGAVTLDMGPNHDPAAGPIGSLAAAQVAQARAVRDALPPRPRRPRRPNVVVILSDDQGWGDLRHNGNLDMSTPNLDRLAREGVRLDRFYVSPVCSPTRAELLTGRYHPRGGVYSTSAGGERLDLDERTVGDAFKAAGYATAAFGKWHNGMQPPYHPNARGFDEFYGFCSGHWGNYFDPVLEHNGRLVRGKGYIADDLTNHAIAFVERNRARPFFLYLPYNTPHSPMQVPDRWWKRFAKKKLAMHNRDPERENPLHQRAALAMCECIDWNVGRLLGKIDALGLQRDTIVLYFSDNGPNGWRFNGGMKGRKGSTDEGGIRSPFIIRWPGRIEGGRVIPGYGGAIDLLPTLVELAGIERVGEKRLDGISLAPALLGTGELPADRLYFSTWRGRVSVRSGPWRLDARGALFDLTRDPGQRRNVSRDHPEVAARLREAVAGWKRSVLGERGPDDRPFPIGCPGFDLTQLPARDGRATGEIRRSNRFPNCSYFTSWTRVEDEITWDVEVLESGRYAVEVYYTCPPSDVGATVELAFAGARLRARVSEPNDPPERGREHDRVERGESYVKDFRPLALGTLELEKGRGPLVLRAIENPSGQVMEVRLLMLRRVAE